MTIPLCFCFQILSKTKNFGRVELHVAVQRQEDESVAVDEIVSVVLASPVQDIRRCICQGFLDNPLPQSKPVLGLVLAYLAHLHERQLGASQLKAMPVRFEMRGTHSGELVSARKVVNLTDFEMTRPTSASSRFTSTSMPTLVLSAGDHASILRMVFKTLKATVANSRPNAPCSLSDIPGVLNPTRRRSSAMTRSWSARAVDFGS